MPPTLLQPALLDRLRGLSLTARKVVEGALHGLHRSPHQGLSIEFVQHRAYTPGDDPRHLDWKVLGRNDRYVLKQYEQETNLRALLLLDSSRSMAYAGPHTPPPERLEDLRLEGLQASGPKPQAPGLSFQAFKPSPPPSANPKSEIPNSKFHYASVCAAALAHLLIQQGDSAGLMFAGERLVHQLPPRATPGQIHAICRTLEAATPAGPTNLPAVLSTLTLALKRKSLLILLSDLFDDPERTVATLGQLTHAGHEVIVVQVLDRREVTFDLGLHGRGITVLRDMETGRDFEAEPALVAHLVRQEIRRFLTQLDQGCRRQNVHLIRTTTDVPPETVLTRYLTWRARTAR